MVSEKPASTTFKNVISGNLKVLSNSASIFSATAWALIAGCTAFINCNSMVSKDWLCFAIAAYSASTMASRYSNASVLALASVKFLVRWSNLCLWSFICFLNWPSTSSSQRWQSFSASSNIYCVWIPKPKKNLRIKKCFSINTLMGSAQKSVVILSNSLMLLVKYDISSAGGLNISKPWLVWNTL